MSIDDPIDPAARGRVESIDLVRGIVMVLMVLDHVRDFFGDARVNPTDLATATPGLFFTRWVTHFCAPTFVFLAGISASLSGERRTRAELSRHLAIRGLWLIVLEETWVNVFIFIVPQFALALVFWVIGWGMIVLAALIYLPRTAIGAIGLAMITLHNLADGVNPSGDPLALAWSFLHAPGLRTLPGGLPILIGYPLIPWVGVMLVGYALGPLFRRPSERRRPVLLALGLATVAGFLVLRWLNGYGNPEPWKPQSSPLLTAMSFLNCQKQPPSLLYLMMTLGPALLALAALDRGMGRIGTPLRNIGRVPLFFYLLQWPLAHGLAILYEMARGRPFQIEMGYGEGLPVVYAAWVVTVALLYFLCGWYAGAKSLRMSRARIGPSDRETLERGTDR